MKPQLLRGRRTRPVSTPRPRACRETERREVATETRVDGPVDNPRSSTLQIVLRLIENAFFRAILPGFDSALSHLASAGSSKK
jgi:hypothetical protein